MSHIAVQGWLDGALVKRFSASSVLLFDVLAILKALNRAWGEGSACRHILGLGFLWPFSR